MPAAEQPDPPDPAARLAAARSRLAGRQADLLAALVGGAPPPPGFDPDRLRVQAGALAGKRREVVARVAPELVHQLGPRFAGLFADYAREHPRPAAGGRADAAAFTSVLIERGELPDPRPGPGRGLLSRLRAAPFRAGRRPAR